jgi:EAL domain-containing protein (putative c-di-GMP-specific phosphodiesterase class I)
LLERLLAATAVPPRYLTLEITESAVMEDPDKALEALIELYALGLGLSIDDFGTGYSSLGYLKKLPASELKIDKSFVMEMDRNQDDATIVKAIIDLAHNLGVNVVAEGVETQEIWEQLRELGCDVGQGYLFSRPIPPEQLVEWIGAAPTAALSGAEEAAEESPAVQRQ